MSKRSDCHVSVVICAYNAESRLPEVMDALAQQVVPPHLSWEILVVDNNSKDRTSEVARSYTDRIGDGSIVHVVMEPQQGLIYARRRGWSEARGSIISYLDDDNVAAPDWVAQVWEFFEKHPRAGLVGPKIYPLTDYEPPPYFQYICQILALRDIGDETLDTTHTVHGPPPGAGMSTRRELLGPILDSESFGLTGRKGEELTSGEDSMIAIAIRHAGWEWWYEPKMVIWHRLPWGRMEVPYLMRLFTGMGLSSVQTAEAILGRPLSTPGHLRYIMRYLVRYVYYWGVGCLHRNAARRLYSRLLRAMFRSIIRVHARSILTAATRPSRPVDSAAYDCGRSV